MRLLPVLTIMAAGTCVTIQGPVNARLRLAVGSPVFSAAVSFFSGTLLPLCLLATGAFGGAGSGFRGLLSAPPWAFLGGALGLSMLLGAIFAIPQAGAVVVICSAVVGQMLGSYAIDAFGLFGVEKVPFSWVRLGALCLACAAAVSAVVTPLAGFLTDRYGRVIVYRNFAIFQLLMAFPVWWVLSQGNLISTLVAVSLLGVGSWGMFGAQGAFLPEPFGARHRYIGVAVAREVSAVIAGGLAPLVSAGIIAWVSRAHAGQPGAGIGAWVGIAAYLALLTLGTVFTTFITPEPKGRDLDDPPDAVQGQTLTAATTREGCR